MVDEAEDRSADLGEGKSVFNDARTLTIGMIVPVVKTIAEAGRWCDRLCDGRGGEVIVDLELDFGGRVVRDGLVLDDEVVKTISDIVEMLCVGYDGESRHSPRAKEMSKGESRFRAAF